MAVIESAPCEAAGVAAIVRRRNGAHTLVGFEVARDMILVARVVGRGAGVERPIGGEEVAPEGALAVGVIADLLNGRSEGIAAEHRSSHRDHNRDAKVIGAREKARGHPALSGLVERLVGPARPQTERAWGGLVGSIAVAVGPGK